MREIVFFVAVLVCARSRGIYPGQVVLVKTAQQEHHKPAEVIHHNTHNTHVKTNVEYPRVPYSFSYTAQGEDGGSSRTETADASGKVTGSYTIDHPEGKRIVDYVADSEGFRANIRTNEAGTKSEDPASIHYESSASVIPADTVYRPVQPAVHVAPVPQVVHVAPIVPDVHIAEKRPQIFQEEYEGPPQPYSFSYEANAGDGSSSRSESGDSTGKVTGSYSLATKEGWSRKVDYTADHNGFVARVDTNEPGTKSENPADVSLYSSAPLDWPTPKRTYEVSGFQHYPAAGPVLVDYGTAAQGGSYSVTHKEGYNAKAETYEPKILKPADTTIYSTAQLAAQPIPQQQFYRKEYQKTIEEYPPQPYAFNYEAPADGGHSSRTESRDESGKVTGSYSILDVDGRTRTVEYIADKEGFRANVKSSEPTRKIEPARVKVHSSVSSTSGKTSTKYNFPPATYTGGKSSEHQKFILVPYNGPNPHAQKSW